MCTQSRAFYLIGAPGLMKIDLGRSIALAQARLESMISESVVTEHEAERQKLENKRAKRAKEEAAFFASEGLSYPKAQPAPQAEKKADVIVQDAFATIAFAWNYEPFMAALCISWAVWCRSACLLLMVAFTLYLFVLALCAWRRYSQCEVKAKIAKAGMHVLHQQQAMMERVRRMNAEAEQDESVISSTSTSSSASSASSATSASASVDGIRHRASAAESKSSSEQVTFSAAEATEVKIKMENLMVISSPASVALHRAIAVRAIRSLFEFVGVCAVCVISLLYVQHSFVGNALLTGSLASGARLAFETTGSAEVWFASVLSS